MAASKSSKPINISKWLPKLSNIPGLRRHKPAAKLPVTDHAEQSGRFLEAFRWFDSNGDGKISSSELQSYFVWVGESITIDEAHMAIADLDADGDGLMDYDDFIRLMKHGNSGGGGEGRDQGGGDDDLKEAFSMFEAEKGSGRITAAGLRRALRRLGEMKSEKECAAMIRAYDLDGDGVLDYHEFNIMMVA